MEVKVEKVIHCTTLQKSHDPILCLVCSGKTSHLIRYTQNAILHYSRHNVRHSGKLDGSPQFSNLVAVKHAADTRTPSSVIRSRDGYQLDGTIALSSLDQLELQKHTVYAIDEVCAASGESFGVEIYSPFCVRKIQAQFFDESLLRFWKRYEEVFEGNGSDPAIFVAGLDLDYRGEPFGHVLDLCHLLEGSRRIPSKAHHFVSNCTHVSQSGEICSRPAPYTQRLDEGGANLISIGDAEMYQPACPNHFVPKPIGLDKWNEKSSILDTRNIALRKKEKWMEEP